MKPTLMLATLLAIAAVFPFSNAIAQEEEHSEHHPQEEAAKSPAAAPEPPAETADEKCKMMGEKMAKMKGEMMSLETSLDVKVQKMKDSSGADVIAAIEDVVLELVTVHKRMEQIHSDMQALMMSHMAEHMGKSKGMEGMMICPMMQEHGSSEESGHDSH
ncbi:MAG: hypothetical protein WD873_06660 [Candidatus Hydrogenedentales bacterium]